ncbi:MAG: VWA domain-containing protein [Planctomycetes bacterium]|nr:VWA domain-containing protein [Planctomycetota bacterium]
MPRAMKSRSGAGFRRAVWGSVALHAAVACALFALLRAGDARKPARAGIDTRAEPHVRMTLPAEVVVEVAPPLAKPQAAEEKRQPEPPEAPKVTRHTDAQVQRAGASEQPVGPPLVAPRAVPNALSAELTALIRRTSAAPAKPQPAVGPRAIHGALAPAQVVVYVLDCSGSMGAGGKFDAARAALVATLEQQPATVRFQVIVYAGGAKPLLMSDGAALPATVANVRAAADALAALEPRGASNHRDALRAAVGFRPDVILLLTDADDLSAAALRPVLAPAQKPVSLCAGLVGATGVERVRELK